MTIRNLLLHAAAETIDPARGPAGYALDLARSVGAHLTALVFELDVVTPRGSTETGRAAALQAERLRMQAEATGVASTVETDRSYAYGVPEVVAAHARLCDLAVAGVGGGAFGNERGVAEHMLFAAGRPLIVVPQDWERGFSAARPVVAWDCSRAAARALGDAMPFLREAEETMFVSFADDKPMESCLRPDVMAEALRRRGIRPAFEQASRSGRPIAEALGEFAEAAGADMLVMGAFGHSRLRDFVLGGATRGVLERPRLPTLLSH